MSNVIGENLKLPICPKCRDTKNIEEGHQMTREYPYYSCPKCEIGWNAKFGIYDEKLDVYHWEL